MTNQNQYARPGTAGRLILFGISLLLLAGFNANGQRYWLGTAGNNWSTPANWVPAGPPQNGDDLFFTNRVGNNIVNDVTNLTLRSMNFYLAFSLSGNDITLTGGIGCLASDNSVDIDLPNIFLLNDCYLDAINQNLEMNCNIDLYTNKLTVSSYNGNEVDFAGTIYGDPSSTFIVARGKTFMFPFDGNLADGLYQVQGGTLVLDCLNGGALQGDLDVWSGGTVSLMKGFQIYSPNTLIEAGGLILLNGNTNSFENVEMRGGILAGGPGGVINLWGRLVVNAANETATISGNLWMNNIYPIAVNGLWSPGLVLSANVSNPLREDLVKTGPNLMVLSGSNNIVGNTTIQQGVIEADSSHAFGTTSVNLEGGALSLRNVNIASNLLWVGVGPGLQLDGRTAALLTCLNTCTWGGPIYLYTNLFVFVAGDLTLSGQITGPGGISFWSGDAHLTGTQGNTYTGTTLVDCDLLDFGKPSGINAYGGPLIVGGYSGGGPFTARWLNAYQNVGADLTLYPNGVVNLNNHNEDFGNVTFNGGEVDTGNGQFAFYQTMTVNPTNVSAVINGYFGLPAGANRVIVVGDGPVDCDLIINAVVFGSPNYFVKQGPGTICMAGANSYNAVTLLEQGTLDIDNSTGLGTWPGLVIFDGATLRLSGSGSTSGGFEVIGSGVGGQGAVEALPNANWTVAGGILLDGPTTFNIGANATLALSGAISSSGPGCSLIKTGPGNLVTAGGGNNTYSGDTLVNNGGLLLAKSPNVISVPGNLIIGPGPAGPATFARLYQTGGLGGTIATVNANSLLDLNGNNAVFTQLNLNDGGSVQTGTGTLGLAGGSLVAVGSLSPLGSHVSSSISGNISLPNGDVTTFGVSPYALFFPFDSRPELDIPAAVTGAISPFFSGFYKEGLGHMRLSGNNSFPGVAEIDGGTLIAASATALGTAAGQTIVNNAATLALDGGITITGESVYLNSSNSPALDSRNGANAWNGLINLSANTIISVSVAGGSLSALGLINGPGSLAKIGPGQLIFGGSANNTYGGDTFVNEGTLVLQRPAGTTAIPHNVAIGTVPGNPVATLLQQSSFSIIGAVTVNGGGLWDLTGQAEGFSSTVPPPITLNGGGSIQTGPSGIVYLPTGGDVIVNPGPNTTSTIAGNIGMDPGAHHFNVGSGGAGPGAYDLVVSAIVGQTSTAASIQKDGAGRMRLTANNSYTGNTAANAGTLLVEGSQPQSAAFVQTGGRLQGAGTVGNLFYNGFSSVVAPGDSPGILTCGNVSLLSGSGVLEIELNGTLPGIGYDQLNVHGTVNLQGVSLNTTLNYASSVGDSFTIINNDGTDAVLNTFVGLPQNATLYIGGELFQISYTGGTGNDVVLTRLVTPPKPALTLQLIPPNSLRLLWQTNDPLFALQFNTDLTPGNWITLPPPYSMSGTNYVVTNSITDLQRFYRLQR
jgi:autotransporter-associated beta strand protein